MYFVVAGTIYNSGIDMRAIHMYIYIQTNTPLAFRGIAEYVACLPKIHGPTAVHARKMNEASRNQSTNACRIQLFNTKAPVSYTHLRAHET